MFDTKWFGIALIALCMVAAVGCGEDGGDDGGDAPANNDPSPDPMPDANPDDPGPMCDFEACGGDPEGQWLLQTECGFSGTRSFSDDCPDSFISVENVAILEGERSEISFESDGSWGQSYFLSGNFELSVPLECIEGATCPDIEAQLHLTQSDKWVCTDTDGVCDCVNNEDLSINDGGVRDSWRVEGNTIVATDTDDEDQIFEFCITGDEMVLRDDDGIVLTFDRAE